MQLHRGRLIDHIHLRAADLAATARFYRAVLEALHIPLLADDERHLACDELWIDARGDAAEASHVHLAFQAVDREAVRRFHAAGLARRAGQRPAGRSDPIIGPYAAFLLDPDGNNFEAVHHGPARRSAPSVVVETDPA